MNNTFYLIKHGITGKFAQKSTMGNGYRFGRFGAIAFNTFQEADQASKEFPGSQVEPHIETKAEIIFGSLEPLWNFDVETNRRKYIVNGYHNAQAFARFIGGSLIVSSDGIDRQDSMPALIKLEGVELIECQP